MDEPSWKRRPPGQFKLLYAGAPALLARVCHELRVAAITNAMVRWDPKQWRVSPGTLTVALILNMLVDRKPLYQVESFYERRDLELLFSEDAAPDAFNDDALGRALDRLAETDLEQWVQSVALCATNTEGLEVRSVHADTTSISVYGEFHGTKRDQLFAAEHPDRELPKVGHGYSKQKRPDLKQYVLGLVVSKEGIPMIGNVKDGNFSDKVWNREVLEAIRTSFLDPRQIVYVADSALMTKKNLRLLGEERIRFISRLPENFSAVRAVKKHAFKKDRWQEIGCLARTTPRGAYYYTASFTESIAETEYRLIVTRSSALDKRTQKKLERTEARERKELAKEAKALMKQVFNCREDALAALEAFQQKHEDGLHRIQGDIVAHTEIQRPQGRPRKDAVYPKVTTYHLRLRLFEPTDEIRQAWLDRESAFVLITNLDETLWTDAEVLKEYKNQTKVEQGFRVYKHPIMDNGTLLKSVRRVKAFAHVAIVALIVAAFLQYRVRRGLADADDRLMLYLQERRTDRPTSVALLKEIDYVTVVEHITPDGDRFRYLNDDLKPDHIRLLELAGYGPDIFLESLTQAAR